MSEKIPEPTEHTPWHPEDGPSPKVWCWPRTDRPALYVWSHGKWRYAPVQARQDWADGRTVYQVDVDLAGTLSVNTRSYASAWRSRRMHPVVPLRGHSHRPQEWDDTGGHPTVLPSPGASRSAARRPGCGQDLSNASRSRRAGAGRPMRLSRSGAEHR
ncbi:hypothetical protein [Streptomyces sp900116325]|uniref:hypothetical protein n=1 Tax=Streptomyces sp. 900116325 TaxID=3154295 RepID=UPI0033B0D4D8